jgi:hypothetical protein
MWTRDALDERISPLVLEYSIAAGKIIKEIQNDPDRELTAHNVFHAYHQQSMAVNDADDSPFVDNTFNYRVDSMKGFVKQELYNGAARELARWKFTSESFLQFVNQMYINNCNYDPIFKALWENDTVRTACKDINANDEDVNIRTLVKLWARYAINGEYLEDLRELMALFPELYTQEPDSKWSPILQELEGTHDLHQESITRMQANNEGHNNHFLCQKQVDSMKLWQDFEVRPDDEHRSDFHKALFSHASVREDFDTLDFLFDLPHYGMAFKELMARLCLHGHSSPQHSSGSSHTQRTRRALRMLFSMSASGGCISPIRINPSCIPPGVTIKASPAWLHWGLWERVRWSVKVRKYGLHWLEEWTKRVCRAEFDEDGSALMLGHEAKRMRIESMRHAGVPEKALETLKEAANEAARRYNEPIGQARERERKERVAANHETSA